MSEISEEERLEMVSSFEKLLSHHSTEADVRRTMASHSGYDEELWSKLAELGILGLIVPPENGGIGGGPLEVEAMMEIAGERLMCGPFLVSSIFAVKLLSSCSDDVLRKNTLSSVCDGSKIFSVACTGDAGKWDLTDIEVSASQHASGWRLNGSASFVPHAGSADCFLIIADDAGMASAFLIEANTEGLTLESLPVNDPTLRLGRLSFADVNATKLIGVSEQDIHNALNISLIALAGEQAGGAKRIFDITVDYLKSRYQFGRQIGSFQAVKHMAADLLIDVESSVSAAREAARAASSNAVEAPQLLHLAAFACADAFSDVSAEAIQLHGGIAYTQEHIAHLYWRRARTNLWLFGSSDFHREEYLKALESVS